MREAFQINFSIMVSVVGIAVLIAVGIAGSASSEQVQLVLTSQPDSCTAK